MVDGMNKGDQEEEVIQSIALDWLTCLRHKDVTVEQITRWQKWLNESRKNAEAFERAERLWQMSDAADLSGLEPTLSELADDDYEGTIPIATVLSAQTEPKNKSTAKFGLLSFLSPQMIAASVAIMMGVWGVVYFMGQPGGDNPETQAVASIVTARAEHRTAHLFDGSEINVGAQSRLNIDFSENTRRITLNRGEVFFDVAPDESRPFVVSTPLGDVTAVGTAFNVRLAEGRIVVTVTEGKVDVNSLSGDGTPENKEAPVRVKAGSSVILLKQAETVFVAKVTAVAAVTSLSWMDKRFVYRSEPMRYVIADINRYSEQKIELMDEAAGNLSYSGVMSPDDVADWIAGLPVVFPVEVEHSSDGSVLIRSRLKAENNNS